jgi:pyridinium-3,5-biscarboxylic acid mononucleotide sulfurtransferase
MLELSPELAAKRDRLLESLAGMERVAVAFSGGVDSALVAQMAFLALGERALAVTAVSPSLASGELDEARNLARQIGIEHRVVETREFENADYLRNAPNRCYFCKSELYTRLEHLLPELGVTCFVNGANVDDLGDYRPGLTAATEHHVRSPLVEAGLTKAEVRALARFYGLPTWDKPASPCLSSRIAYGVEVTPERVARIDAAERFLKESLGLRELRVRCETGELARIELPVSEVGRLVEPGLRAEVARALRELGFRRVTLDLEGFRSGSLNEGLPLVQLGRGAGGQD